MNNDEWAGLSLVLFFLVVILAHAALAIGIVWGLWEFVSWLFWS